MFKFEELDDETRAYMLRFTEEQMAIGPLRPSERFTAEGTAAYPEILKDAISKGNEVTLARLLDVPHYWETKEPNPRKPGAMKKVPHNRHEQFAITEFNTYYVQGLARKLIDEGETRCEIYRAEQAKRDSKPCPLIKYEGIPILLDMVIAGYRQYGSAKLVTPQGICVPDHANCHHCIRRVRGEGQEK